MIETDILVVGAGASGLMAAGFAAKAGAKVLLLEKMERPARKLRITGKGRCNLTNTAEPAEFISHFGKNGRFLHKSIGAFFSKDLIAFFNTLGVATKTERGGRVFPQSDEAQEIVDALVTWAKNCGVTIKSGSSVQGLIVEDGRIVGAKDAQGESYRCSKLVLACGGASYPGTGSSGDGYRLAKEIGHKIKSVHPALIPLITAGDTAERLQGLSLKNADVSLWIDGKKQASEFGEMLFTHFGLSGPCILSLSGKAVEALDTGKKVEVSIDLKPALDDGKLDARLQRELSEHGKKQFQNILPLLLPRTLIAVCIDEVGIEASFPCHQVSAKQRHRLRSWLKDFRLKIEGYRPIKEAIVTAGGVSLKQVDSKSMESRLVEGLYFCGEVLDIDADTGGFNLQAAFSTGVLAGKSAACALEGG